MKHIILMLAHREPYYISSLVDYFDEDFAVYIHLDKKSNFSKKDITHLAQKKNVKLVSKRFKTNWGGYNILKAELYLLKKAYKDNPEGYFHLISGQDIPTRDIEEFKHFFKKNKGKEFLSHAPFPRREWENGTFDRFRYYRPHDIFDSMTAEGKKICNKIINFQKKHKIRKKKPNQFRLLYGGSAWFSLSAECVKYVLDYTKKQPAFYKALKYTFAPDESYLTTILAQSRFRENIINDNLRYIDWKYRNKSIPAILDINDYPKIMGNNYFFARKITFPVSRSLVDALNTVHL